MLPRMSRALSLRAMSCGCPTNDTEGFKKLARRCDILRVTNAEYYKNNFVAVSKRLHKFCAPNKCVVAQDARYEQL